MLFELDFVKYIFDLDLNFLSRWLRVVGCVFVNVCVLFYMMDMWNVLMIGRENYFEMNEFLWMLILLWNNYYLVGLDLFVCMFYFGGIGDLESRIY